MIITKRLVRDFLEYIISNKSIKTVLDVGCGNGKMSPKLADSGMDVTGVDKEPTEIKNPCFKFIQSSISEFKFKQKYDLIIASRILHLLRAHEARSLLREIMKNTEEGGFNFLICLSDKDDFANEKPMNFYPSIQALRKIYSDWDIVEERNGFTELSQHGNTKPHRHNLYFLLARKPSSKVKNQF